MPLLHDLNLNNGIYDMDTWIYKCFWKSHFKVANGGFGSPVANTFMLAPKTYFEWKLVHIADAFKRINMGAEMQTSNYITWV